MQTVWQILSEFSPALARIQPSNQHPRPSEHANNPPNLSPSHCHSPEYHCNTQRKEMKWEKDDCGNLFLHPLALLQDPTSWGRRPSFPRLQIIFISRTVPPPPGYNNHPNNPPASSSSAGMEGNTAHPSPRQRKAKKLCCHHNPWQAGAASCQAGVAGIITNVPKE